MTLHGGESLWLDWGMGGGEFIRGKELILETMAMQESSRFFLAVGWVGMGRTIDNSDIAFLGIIVDWCLGDGASVGGKGLVSETVATED